MSDVTIKPMLIRVKLEKLLVDDILYLGGQEMAESLVSFDRV